MPVSEADRSAAVDQLRRHVGADHLTLDEFAQRAGHVYGAETPQELGRALRGLPALPDDPDEPSTTPPSHSRFRLRRSSAAFVAMGGTTVGVWGLTGGGEFWPGWVLLITGGALAFDLIRGRPEALRVSRLRVGSIVVTGVRSKNTDPAVLKVSARRERPGPEAPPLMPMGPVDGHLELDRVTFRQPRRTRPALDRISLDIAAGEHVALLGPSGAGKSAVLAMLSRLFDPDDGTVRVDGRDLRDFAASSIRRRIQTVTQDTFLFDGSLRDNVAYGSPHVSGREIERVLRALGTWDRFRRHGGLDARLHEHDSRFPPSDRHLIALARALLGSPDVLLLDDVTAGLDPTEASVSLDAVLGHPGTVVVATADRAVAAKASRVLTLESGRVVADGPPDRVLR